MYIRERHLLYFIIQRGNCFSIIESLLIKCYLVCPLDMIIIDRQLIPSFSHIKLYKNITRNIFFTSESYCDSEVNFLVLR